MSTVMRPMSDRPATVLRFLALDAPCPRCGNRAANVRITERVRERYRSDDPGEVFGSVKCTWQEKGRTCGEMYLALVSAVQNAA
jgi:hypothetical protein